MTALRSTTELTADREAVGELVALVLAGAEANERPDLVDRLTRAGALVAAAGKPHSAIGSDADIHADAEIDAATGTAARSVVAALQSLQIDLRARQAMLRDPGRTPRLVAEMRHAEDRQQRFQDVASEWPQMLGEGLSATNSDLEFEIRSRGRALLDEGTQAIESGRLTGAAFDTWLSERLQADADAAYERLRVAVQVGVHHLITRLGLPDSFEPSQPPLLPTAQLVAQCTARPAASTASSPLSGRLLGVVMPTYGGTMMTLVIPRFLGLRLPVWGMLGGAAIGALTMGGAAIAGERQRQRARRNGESIAGLRTTMDTFQMTLTKQVRDGIRAAQQEVRRFVTAAASQQGQRLSAEAGAARRAAEDTRRTAEALREIDDDLGSLRDLRDRAVRIARRSGTGTTGWPAHAPQVLPSQPSATDELPARGR